MGHCSMDNAPGTTALTRLATAALDGPRCRHPGFSCEREHLFSYLPPNACSPFHSFWKHYSRTGVRERELAKFDAKTPSSWNAGPFARFKGRDVPWGRRGDTCCHGLCRSLLRVTPPTVRFKLASRSDDKKEPAKNWNTSTALYDKLIA